MLLPGEAVKRKSKPAPKAAKKPGRSRSPAGAETPARKQAEGALRESKARLEEAQRIARMGSWEWIAATDTPTWSKELCAILEVDPARPVPTLAEQHRLYTPDSMDRMNAAVERAMQTGKPYEIELERVRKDGSRRWLLARGEPWFDERGQLIGLRGTALDITERKQAEETFAAQQRMLDGLIKAVPDLIYFKDRESRFIRINEAFAWRAGMTDVHAALGKTDFDIFGEPHARQAYEDEQRIVATGQPMINKEEREDWPDGRVTWATSTKVPLFDGSGKIVGIMGISRDITERKQTEEALARERNLLRTILDVLPDYIYLKDEQSRFIVCNNRRADNDAIQNTEELIGKTDADFFPPEQATRFRADELTVLSGTPLINKEETLIRPDGSKQVILTSKLPFRDSNGKIVGLVGYGRDITESKRAEEKLATEQHLLNSLITTTPARIYFKDRESRFIKINEAFARMHEFSDPRMLVGKTDFDIFGGQHARQAYEDEQRIMATGEPMIGQEEREDWPDGHVTWASSTKLPLRDSGGKIIGIVGVSRDVTERKKTEEKLKLFHTLIERSNDSIHVVDPAMGRFLDVNESGCRALGYTRDELLAMTVFDVTVGVDRAMFDTTGARMKKTGHAMLEALHRRKDGTTYPVELSLSPVTLEREYLVAIVRDITERKRAEESYARLAKAVEQAAETIVITDTDGTIVYANPAFERTSGYACNEARGQNSRFLKSGKQDAGFYRRMWDVLLHGQTWSGHFVNRRKDGTLYEEEATISPVRDVASNIVNYVAVKRDVTREVQLEAQLRQSQKMEAIGQLAGGVAHDFNNILGAMMMQAEMAAMVENTPEEVREGLHEIRAAAERAANLTRQLLLFSRRQVMQPRDLDLNEIVTSLAKMLQRIIGEDVQLQLHLHSAPLIIHADAGMLDQVLVNLAVNARDAMPGGGRLLIETAEKIVDENMAGLNPDAAPGHFAYFSVSDTGSGILPEVMPRIFEPFFTTKEPGKGTGLGLATVFGIGQGAHFQIFLPASTATDVELAQATARPKPRGGTETILLVEDESAVRSLTRVILERHGYKVLDAVNGVEALNLWREHREAVSLLLTDLVMPAGLSGQQLARQIHAEKPDLKVVFTSGYSAEIAGRELQLRSGENFLQKPFASDQLLETVRRCLDG